MLEGRRKPRPGPIQIPKLSERQEHDPLAKSAERTSSPPLTPENTSLQTQDGFFTSTISSLVSPSSTTAGQQDTLQARISHRTTTIRSPTTLQTTTLRTPPLLSTEATTQQKSPTATTIITIATPTRSQAAEPESPEADEVVFISQLVTVTVAPQITLPPNSKDTPPVEIIPVGASVPLIVMGVLGAVAIVVILAIVIWRKRRKTRALNTEKPETSRG